MKAELGAVFYRCLLKNAELQAARMRARERGERYTMKYTFIFLARATFYEDK